MPVGREEVLQAGVARRHEDSGRLLGKLVGAGELSLWTDQRREAQRRLVVAPHRVRAESCTSNAAMVGYQGAFRASFTHVCSDASSVVSPTSGPPADCSSAPVVVEAAAAEPQLARLNCQ